MRLGRIGFDRVVGYLQDGFGAVESTPELIVRTERLSATVAAERLASNEPPQLLDVRAPAEYEARHIDGSLSVPLNQLAAHARSLPTDRPLLVLCAGGYRSSIAASLLQQLGFDRISEMAGGLAAWEAARLPITSSPRHDAT